MAQMVNARVVLAYQRSRRGAEAVANRGSKKEQVARHGSRRSPLWSGGGVTFGPNSERVFSVKMNRKARRKALYMVLSDKVAHERFVVVDDLTFEIPKTSGDIKRAQGVASSGRTDVAY